MRGSGRGTAAGAVLVLSTMAVAGPDWEEGAMATGDAGKLPATAQRPIGPELTDLDSIEGALEAFSFELGPAGPTDFQDLYVIWIDDPSCFSATTETVSGGMSAFDSQLWLFQPLGFGLLGTDGLGFGATLTNLSDDGTNVRITTAGLYVLGISSFNSDPIDSASLPLFAQTGSGEVSGPDGSGGANPVADWTTTTTGGMYRIILCGVFFPPQCPNDCGDDNGSVDVADLLEILAEWGTPPPHDCDIAPAPGGDGVIDIEDLLAVLADWGSC
ncbi:MAG: hypothetical protein ACYTG1_11515 [Planctomycetota bacterium]|jgi:hypothetical protein